MLTPEDGFVNGSALRMPHQCTGHTGTLVGLSYGTGTVVQVFKL